MPCRPAEGHIFMIDASYLVERRFAWVHDNKLRLNMARPIKETPILKGKDAKRFSLSITKNETRRMPSSDFKKAMSNYNRILKSAILD